MGDSYRALSEEYKQKKKEIVDGYDNTPHKKKKKKNKSKRANHKHKYVPGVYHLTYSNFNSNGKKNEHVTCGSHCKECGRVKDMMFMWSHEEERVERFKKEYPDYVEIYLPDGWDYFRNKNIPV